MRFLLLASIFFIIYGCENKSAVQSSALSAFTGATMGTYYSIKIDGAKVDKEQLKKEVDSLLKDLNQTFSTYLKDSELSRINQYKKEAPIKLSDEMNLLLVLAKQLTKQTDGAFDPTVGPIVNRWGFGPKKDQNKPTEQEIKKLMLNVGDKNYSVANGSLIKKKPKLYLDLSAMAKGYGVDKVANFLKMDKGYQNILVEIGGEVRAFGYKTGNQKWAIGVETPSAQLGAGIQKVVPLVNMSVATSGSYRNYLKYGDKVFSHTINPQTGMPVNHKLVSVTVLDPDCAIADAWATALMVMGPKKGLEVAKKKGLMAYFLVKKEDSFEEISTKKFSDYLQEFKRSR